MGIVKNFPTGQNKESPQYPPDENAMQAVSKDLLDAKLEAIEARMDTRVAGMSAKLDTALAEMRADRETNNIRFATMFTSIGEVKTNIQAVSIEAKEQAKSVRSSVWGATVATISIVAAIVAFGISAFDSGRETSKNIAEATARLEKLQAQLEKQASPVAPDKPAKPAEPAASK